MVCMSRTHLLKTLSPYDFLSSHYVTDDKDHKLLDSDTTTFSIFTLFNVGKIKACNFIITLINGYDIKIKPSPTMPHGSAYDSTTLL